VTPGRNRQTAATFTPACFVACVVCTAPSDNLIAVSSKVKVKVILEQATKVQRRVEE
jgi:hypothetical protein